MNGRIELYRPKGEIDISAENSSWAQLLRFVEKENAHVLDVGCACGDVGLALKRHRRSIVCGIEKDCGAVAIARECGAYELVRQCDLDELDACDLASWRDRFDYLILGDVLEHLRNPARTLKELLSCLKQGGRVVASIPNVANMYVKAQLLVDRFIYTEFGLLDVSHVRFFTYYGIAELMAGCGLEVENCGFTMCGKNEWQSFDPWPEILQYGRQLIFRDWHSFVCQYVFVASRAECAAGELIRQNARRLDIDESNAPGYIRESRERLLAEQGEPLERQLKMLAEQGKALAQSKGECRELKSELESCRRELNAREHDLAEAKVKLGEAQAETVRVQGEVTALQHEGEARRAELDEMKARFDEEHAKAEYLYYLQEEMKKSWSWRLVGKYALRKRAKGLARRMTARLHRVGKVLFLRLPMSFVTRRRIKDVLYSRFGFLLRDVKGYQDWIQLNQLIEELMVSADTGLVVPKDVPLTSIVIPVYNNLALTRVCVQSIYDIKSKSPFEIIVVDDCSTEDIASLQREFPGVRVVRNERNSGFLLTANRGGREARGEYIIFLNNDTSVLPGWLDELTTALYAHPESGMIGSQLIHMSTRLLQESGNLICKDGRMLPLGRGKSPNDPDYTYFREVDFCSAASIILRKSVFDKVNGFDTAYAPAYFEDPDLALRLQKAGYRNYVMPLSRVMHQEMASYGATLDERCERNRKFFVDRWKDYLAEHALYDTPEAMAAERKFSRPRILYIDAEVPMADRGSGGMDAIYFLEYFLQRGYEVVFHGEYTPGFVPKYTPILLRMGVECVYAPQRKIWEYIASEGKTFSLLFVSRIYQARCFDRLLKRHCSQAAYVFNTVDVHFVREQLEAELRKDENLRRLAADTKRYELQVAGSADATIVISQDEKRLLSEGYGLKNIWHVPQMREVHGRAENTKRDGAVFIGSAHPPNMDGLKYFHDEILPLLPKSFKLTIVGEALKKTMGGMQEYSALLACPQFEFVGFVQNLGDVLDTALMTIAPLRYGAGTKGKVASSMSYGVPCVSSRFGTEGTGMEHGENILIASTAEEFADDIRKLSEDPALWRRISDGGIQFLNENYSRKAVDSIMDEMLAALQARQRPSTWTRARVLPKVDEKT